jgi:hypothetical protein
MPIFQLMWELRRLSTPLFQMMRGAPSAFYAFIPDDAGSSGLSTPLFQMMRGAPSTLLVCSGLLEQIIRQ